MINPKEFYDFLLENEIEFFTGVPDSLLKNFNSVIIDNSPKEKHVISANEGGSIALASGYYLATKKLALVYMQNSGQGNAINPLLSLADKEVYGIPMVILFGWRGEPGKEDEPQHVKQGEVSLKILEAMGVPYSILPEEIDSAKQILKKAVDISTSCNMPYVLVVRKNTFEKYISLDKSPNLFQLSREDSLRLIVNNLSERDLIVSTTGKLSRELFELREELGQNHGNDFLTVGSMGHSSQIALGISLSKPARNIFCLDGDGSLIMHQGSLGIIGQQKPNNFKHIIFNNGAHDSVGGQPTIGFEINIPKIALASGYKFAWSVEKEHEIIEGIKRLREVGGPSLLEIKINKGSRKDLGRPTRTPFENKKAFMDNLNS